MQGTQNVPKGRIDKHFTKGVLFITYSLLVMNAKAMKDEALDPLNDRGERQLDARLVPGSRLEQIVDWLKGEHFSNPDESAPLIVLDECHKAKNLIATSGGMPQYAIKNLIQAFMCHMCLTIQTSICGHQYCNKHA